MKDARDIYILGRSIHFPICLEGALKIKELAYIHAEGMIAGKMKHGLLAMIDMKSVVIIMNPYDSTYIDTVSTAHEIKSRGSTVIGLSNSKNDAIYDYSIDIPKVHDSLTPCSNSSILFRIMQQNSSGSPAQPCKVCNGEIKEIKINKIRFLETHQIYPIQSHDGKTHNLESIPQTIR